MYSEERRQNPPSRPEVLKNPGGCTGHPYRVKAVCLLLPSDHVVLPCRLARYPVSAVSIPGSLERHLSNGPYRPITAPLRGLRTDIEAASPGGNRAVLANAERLDRTGSSRGHHDHERIRGTLSPPNAITPSNLRRDQGTKPGTTAAATHLGGRSRGRSADDHM
jgi:hypothetical protein